MDLKYQRTLELWSKYPIEVQIPMIQSVKEFLPEEYKELIEAVANSLTMLKNVLNEDLPLYAATWMAKGLIK